MKATKKVLCALLAVVMLCGLILVPGTIKVSAAAGEFVKVESTDTLTTGDVIVIGKSEGKNNDATVFAGKYDNKELLIAEDASLSGIGENNAVTKFTLVAVKETNYWNLKTTVDGNEKYLSSTTGSGSRPLKYSDTANEYTEMWEISVAENGEATIKNKGNSNLISYNTAKVNRFKTYTSIQKPVVIYRFNAKDAADCTFQIFENDELQSGSDDFQEIMNNVTTGQTIKLHTDATVSTNIVLDKGITLDLNGHTLTADGDYLIALDGNNVIDSAAGTAENAKGSLFTIGQVILPEKNAMIPVYDSVEMTYQFYEVIDPECNTIECQHLVDNKDGSFTYDMRPNFGSLENGTAIANGCGEDLKVMVEITWQTDTQKTVRHYEINKDELVNMYTKKGLCFYMKLNHASETAKAHGGMDVHFVIESSTGVRTASKVMHYAG